MSVYPKINRPVRDMITERVNLILAIENYEKLTGFQAVAYRALPKHASWESRLAAAQADLRWFDQTNQEATSELRRAVNYGFSNL